MFLCRVARPQLLQLISKQTATVNSSLRQNSTATRAAINCHKCGLVPVCRRYSRGSSSSSSGGGGGGASALLGLSFFGLFGGDEQPEEDPIVTTIKRGLLAVERDDLPQAEQMFHMALKMAQELQDEDAITFIFDSLANVAYRSGKLETAEKLFLDVIQRQFSLRDVPEDDGSILEISLKLATIYAMTERADMANEGFKFCLDKLEPKVKDVDVDEDTLGLWGMSCDWYARFLVSQGKMDMAEKYFDKALAMSETVQVSEDKNDINQAVLLNSLGMVCTMQEKYEAAEKYMLRAVTIAKKADAEELTSFYINLGSIFMKRKLFAEASEYCNLGLSRANGKNDVRAVEAAHDCLDHLKAAMGK